MKTTYLLFISIFFLFSCFEKPKNKEVENTKTDSIESVPEIKEPAIAKVDDAKYSGGFYIVNVSATPNIDEAVQQVQKLQEKGHRAGYLWLPDYESLSNKELYAVFIGPYIRQDTCFKYLRDYQKEDPKAYAVEATHNKERITMHSKFDIRLNNKRQYMILTYSTPEDSEEYAEGGGEDWAWFVNDVYTYFSNYHKNNVHFGSVYWSWFNKKDIAELVAELDMEGFGYVLVKGNEKTFIPHDMPNGVISQACEFFGFEMNENWQEEMNN